MKKKRAMVEDRTRIVWSIGIGVISVFSALSVWHLITVWPKESFEQKIMGSILRQGDWYVRNQTAQGDFIYERYAATGESREGNNIVRQAGALYGLAQLYAQTKDPEIRKTLEKGFGYFREHTATPSAETNAIAYNDDIQSNTTALLVLALVEYLEADDARQTTERLEYLVRLSNYLVSTQVSSGAYINSYTPEPVESDYNNGETMYALIRSYRLTKRDAHLLSVKRMANYAIYSYGKHGFNSSFFSWGMAGFAHLYRMEPDERYWVFLREYADKYMKGRGNGYERSLAGKAASVITPGTSVFLEGVAHIAWIAKDKDTDLYRRLTHHVEKVLKHLLRYEIGSPYGMYVADTDAVRGAICAQATCETTRIDFLQHNISAIILYERLIK